MELEFGGKDAEGSGRKIGGARKKIVLETGVRGWSLVGRLWKGARERSMGIKRMQGWNEVNRAGENSWNLLGSAGSSLWC